MDGVWNLFKSESQQETHSEGIIEDNLRNKLFAKMSTG